MTPTFWIDESAVPILIRADYRPGGGIVSEFLKWILDERMEIPPVRAGGVSGEHALQFVHRSNLPRIREWLKSKGAVEGDGFDLPRE